MTRARWLDAAKLLFGLLVLALVVNTARQQWPAIRPVLEDTNLGAIGLALLLQVVGFAFLPFASQSAIRIWKPKFGYLSSARIFFQSQLAKYLPGSIWVFPTRVYLTSKAGLSLPGSSYVLVLETAALCASSLLIGGISFAGFPAKAMTWRSVVMVLAILGFGATFILRNRPAWLFRLVPTKWRPPKQTQEPGRKSLVETLVSGSSLAISWVLSGLSFFVVLQAIGAGLESSSLLAVVSAFSLAWLLGFLVVISPGGIGVREAALVFLLSGLAGSAQISVAVVMGRLLWFACELMLYFLFSHSRLGAFHAE